MSTEGSEIISALAPLRRALLDAAAERAEQVRVRAQDEAATVVTEARRDANGIIEAARRDGRADGEAVLASARTRARRHARAAVLAAQQQVYQELQARAADAVTGLRQDPGYGLLRAGLDRAVRDTLGEDAEVRESGDGGVIGVAGGRRMDCSLHRLADRAVEDVAGSLFETAGQPRSGPT